MERRPAHLRSASQTRFDRRHPGRRVFYLRLHYNTGGEFKPMNSVLKIVADLLPYMFAAIGLEILSGKIRKLKERVAELEGEIARLKPGEPRSPHYEAMRRQAERTRQFLLEREQRQSSDLP
jgi:hypothetical protein